MTLSTSPSLSHSSPGLPGHTTWYQHLVTAHHCSYTTLVQKMSPGHLLTTGEYFSSNLDTLHLDTPQGQSRTHSLDFTGHYHHTLDLTGHHHRRHKTVTSLKWKVNELSSFNCPSFFLCKLSVDFSSQKSSVYFLNFSVTNFSKFSVELSKLASNIEISTESRMQLSREWKQSL